MSTWITGDTHFNHAGILKYTDRPWETVQEMNEAMMTTWNETVGPKDTVWHLGDFGYRYKELPDLADIFANLNGNKHLVIGNHDEQNKQVLDLPWKSQHDLATIKHEGRRVIACHYPLTTWKHPNKYVMMHGHSHGGLRDVRPRRMDVGIDCHPNHGLFPFEETADMLAKQTYDKVDHH